MSRALQFLFFFIFIRPIVYIILGLNVRNWGRLPVNGPAVIVANHNSHLDTLVLMSLLPMNMLPKLRPVAAADYFLKNKALAWFATKIIGIVPIVRRGGNDEPLAGCYEAMDAGDILILFPEGTRGDPENSLGAFKKGVQVLAQNRPEVPVYPVFLHGSGKIFPKGSVLPLPFCCDVFIGSHLDYETTGEEFMGTLVSFFTKI